MSLREQEPPHWHLIKWAARIVEAQTVVSAILGASGVTLAGMVLWCLLGATDFIAHNPAVVFSILVLLSVISVSASIALFIYRSRKDRLKAVTSEFRSFGRKNAECDKALFDALYKELQINADSAEPLRRALGSINDNIVSILDDAASIFEMSTGHRCCASLRLIDHRTGEISCVARDRVNPGRDGHNKPRPLSSNSAYEALLGEVRSDSYIENDLGKLYKDHKFKNTREGWRRDYNAICVVPTRNLGGEVHSRRDGCLWIDNKYGGFDKKVCFDYAEEISWRLAVMVYRQREIVMRLDLLEKAATRQ